MVYSHFLKSFLICYFVLFFQYTCCGIRAVLVMSFLKTYYKVSILLGRESERAEKKLPDRSDDYKVFKKALKCLRNTEWDYFIARNAPMALKLQRNDELALCVVDEVCRRYGCEEQKDYLKGALADEHLFRRSVLRISLMNIFRIIYASVEGDYNDYGAKDEITFFLDQFPAMRKHLLKKLMSTDFDWFMCKMARQQTSMLHTGDIQNAMQASTPEGCIIIKDVSDRVRNSRD